MSNLPVPDFVSIKEYIERLAKGLAYFHQRLQIMEQYYKDDQDRLEKRLSILEHALTSSLPSDASNDVDVQPLDSVDTSQQLLPQNHTHCNDEELQHDVLHP